MYFDDGFNPMTGGAKTFLDRLRAGWRPSEPEAMEAAHRFRASRWEWENILAPVITLLAEFDADDQHEFWREMDDSDLRDQKSIARVVAPWALTARLLSDPVTRSLLGDLDETEFVEVPRPNDQLAAALVEALVDGAYARRAGLITFYDREDIETIVTRVLESFQKEDVR